MYSIADGTLEAFIETAYDPEITAGHRAAATNAICSLLEFRHAGGETTPLDKNLWLEILSVVLDRSEGAKGKSMRHLLGVQIGLLSAYTPDQRKEIENLSLARVFQTVLAQTDQGKVKASLQVFTMFLAKKAVSVERLIDSLLEYEGRTPISPSDVGSRRLILQYITRKLFDWIQYQDSALAAGQAVCVLLQQIEDVTYQQSFSARDARPPPSWIKPLIESVSDHPEALTNLRYHLFPSLFAMNVQDYIFFLNELGLQSAFHGTKKTTENQSVETTFKKDLLYVSLQVGKECGFVLDVCR
jgi:hypothetical protein